MAEPRYDAHAGGRHVVAQRHRLERAVLHAACRSASASATNAPVMDAVRVPPSACSTSQSIMTVRSPSAVSVHHRRAWSGRSAAGSRACGRKAGPWSTSRGVRLRGGARQHGILRRHPALPRIAQERRHGVLHRGGAQHVRVAHFDQRRAFGRHQVAGARFLPAACRPVLTIIDSHCSSRSTEKHHQEHAGKRSGRYRKPPLAAVRPCSSFARTGLNLPISAMVAPRMLNPAHLD